MQTASRSSFAIIVMALLLWLPAAASAADYSDMVMDANSGEILHQTNADEPRFPASLAKMMTLYIVFDMLEKHRLSLDSPLTISDYDASAPPSKLGLSPGESITVNDAIKALVTASANDVARAIAENLGGDEDKFAAYMTWQAHKLGMTHTTYRNASGLPDPEQTTTARDYITLSLHLYDDFPQYFDVFKTQYFAWGRARYRNHNGLLFNFPGADGIKTGYTHLSGFNLAESVHRNGRHIIGVIFGGRSIGERNARMRSLLTAGLAKGSTVASRIAQKRAAELAAKTPPKAKTKVVTAASFNASKTTATGAPGPDALGALIQRTATAKSSSTLAAVAAAPVETPSEMPMAAGGAFDVQIGSFATETEARQRLDAIVSAGSGRLSGHPPLAVVFNKADKVWYRARFAGFARPEADQACTELKTRHIDCLVMRAD